MHKEGSTARKRFWFTMYSRYGGFKKKKPKVQINESTKWVPKFKNFTITIVRRNYIVRFLYFTNCKLQVIDNQFESIAADN